MEYNTLLLTV